ncbi:hypothetical protein AOQ84DRAFT_187791 [Glonium stellatum]|uniref:Uncharacterized protein n=1 Tax=Glonium stellatum TaxID=574774 RepID=A0A8E2EP65_9PEZI|nr:hypothetical protein AOQ84DRAFT_187791 [Glonium stellatum]
MAEAAGFKAREVCQVQTAVVNPSSAIIVTGALRRISVPEDTTTFLRSSLSSVSLSDDSPNHLRGQLSSRPMTPENTAIAFPDTIKPKPIPQISRSAMGTKLANIPAKVERGNLRKREVISVSRRTARLAISKRKHTRISVQRVARWSTALENNYSSWPVGQRSDKLETMEIQKNSILGYGARALPEAPSSVIGSSTELYHHSASQSSPHPSHLHSALQPIPANTGWAQSAPLTWSRVSSTGNSSSTSPERSSSARSITLRSGSVLTMVSPEETAWDHPIYLHGPIRLNKQLALSQKNSIATIEPFLDAVETLEEQRRRASDDATTDEIVDFFRGLGIVDAFEKHGLDRYWDRSTRPPGKALPPIPPPSLSPASSTSSLLPLPPPHLRLRNSTSLPQVAPHRVPPPQKMKLRRLLNSASSIV